MKKIIILLLLFPLILLMGCWDANELNDFAFVQGVGIDKGTDGSISITTQLAKPGQLKIKGDGSNQKAYWNIQNEDKTILSAVRGINRKSGRNLYFSHNKIMLISWDAAKDGIGEYIDFFARDHETRIANQLIISRQKASEVLNVDTGFERIPSVSIEKMIHNQEKVSGTIVTELTDFIDNLLSRTTSSVVPIVEITGQEEEKTLEITGGAVFKEDKLVGELNLEESRGLLWILGKTKGGVITVELPDIEGKIDMEIIKGTGKITAEIKNGKPTFLVEVRAETSLDAQTCPVDLAKTEMLKKIETVQSEAIKKEMESALKKAQELDTDIFGFGEAVFMKNPNEWKTMEPKWDELFKDVKVEFKVDSLVNGVGVISKPPMIDTE